MRLDHGNVALSDRVAALEESATQAAASVSTSDNNTIERAAAAAAATAAVAPSVEEIQGKMQAIEEKFAADMASLHSG